jgi:hypothetical protein
MLWEDPRVPALIRGELLLLISSALICAVLCIICGGLSVAFAGEGSEPGVRGGASNQRPSQYVALATITFSGCDRKRAE